MREITSHVVNPANDKLKIHALDEPGSGGANHLYLISGFNSGSNPSDPFIEQFGTAANHSTILFQNGPIGEGGTGVNGLTHEALIAILIDRLEAFQNGKYKCPENAEALLHLKYARGSLHGRTLTRMARGVEGTHKV